MPAYGPRLLPPRPSIAPPRPCPSHPPPVPKGHRTRPLLAVGPGAQSLISLFPTCEVEVGFIWMGGNLRRPGKDRPQLGRSLSPPFPGCLSCQSLTIGSSSGTPLPSPCTLVPYPSPALTVCPGKKPWPGASPFILGLRMCSSGSPADEAQGRWGVLGEDQDFDFEDVPS